MASLFFQSHEITLYRRRRIGSTNRFNMSATYTAYPADIQPASRERTQMVEGRFGAVFTAFIDASIDAREGDQVVVSSFNGTSNKRFSIKGIQVWEGAGLLSHKELILISQDGY